jgi:FKBP-type peptidyl-prolyl cis-trans isomerase
MKKLLILAAAAAFVLSSCGNIGSGKLSSEEDSLAYSVGIDLGQYIKNMDSTLNIDVVAAAIKDVIDGKQKMSQDTAYAFLREYFTVRKPAKQKKASEEFLAGVEKDTEGIQKTESGLLYVVENPGNEVKATKDVDQVRVMYKGTLPDGQVFDSSYDRGDTAQFALNQVIKGWSEGMKLVGEGGKIKLWIPSDLAYGEQGAGNGQIGPNQAIQFEVELVSVIPGEEEPATEE